MTSNNFGVDSVDIANAILQKCFKQELPITFGQLERCTLRVDRLHLRDGGTHAFGDIDYPAITWKTATVDRAKQVKKYIPRATGSPTAARPPHGSTLHFAIIAALEEHRTVLGE